MRRQTAWLLVLVCLGLPACGYTTRGLYPVDVQTVSVPIFRSNGLRRDVEFQLTQQVIQAIEAKTPFKVVDAAIADTEIIGEIKQFYKSPFGEDARDNPRGGNMVLLVAITWLDNRTGEVIKQGEYQLNSVNSLETQRTFIIDTGESYATATNAATLEMAEYVVNLMQSPW